MRPFELPRWTRRLLSAGESVRAGAATALGTQAVAHALGLAASVLIARSLGADGRGAYVLPVTTAATCVAFSQLGLELATNYVAAERGYTLARLTAATSLLAILVAPTAVGAMLAFYLLARDGLLAGVGWVELLIAAAVVPFNVHNIWLANLIVIAKRLPQTQLATLAGAFVQTAGTGLVAAAGILTVRSVLLLWAASIVVPWALNILIARRFAPVRPAVDREALRLVVSLGARLYAVTLFNFLLLRIDVFLVNQYAGVEAVGIYTLAVLFAEMIWLLGHPLVTAVLAFQVSTAREAAGLVSFKAARFNLGIAFVIALGFTATGWFAIPLVYGNDFADVYLALVVLLPGILAMAAARPLSNWLLRAGRPASQSALYVGAFVLNVALNVILIPELGLVGASVASSVAYCVLAAGLIGWAMRASGLSLRGAWSVQPGDIASVRGLLGR